MKSEITGKYFGIDKKIKDVISDPAFGKHGYKMNKQ